MLSGLGYSVFVLRAIKHVRETSKLQRKQQIRRETALRTGCVQREIKGTVVSASLQSEDTYLVEIECDGIDIAAFEILRVSLPYKRVASETTAGSRLMLICGPDTEVVPGARVDITLGSPEGAAKTY
jgi:hypothetical protein